MSVGDKISNAAEKAAGAAKETVGKATGDRETQAEGAAQKKQAEMKQAGEKTKDAAKDLRDGFTG
ncbi:CsbD family protein [Nesterenkonia sp. E16_7]|uniref:CsbD family protein n=1 Tax=unclassified Nesterenkonia TaxID=2629769 RepID=UPI001A91CED6|nr:MULTISPECIES: CsbD family protein [unclassified Nesterenkonia]MBO0596980.1 CsbD family protein [Nesterenkonia sp. E16_10]MBO0599869.1 CsbD family protein [Nesterenkonia sp. E16_7]